MTDREKLIELLEVDLSGSDGYEPELIADHLLSHGVTFADDINVPTNCGAEMKGESK